MFRMFYFTLTSFLNLYSSLTIFTDCIKGATFHKVDNIDSNNQISSAGILNLDEAKSRCIDHGDACSAIIMKSSKLVQTFHLMENGGSVVRGSDVIYYKFLKRGLFVCFCFIIQLLFWSQSCEWFTIFVAGFGCYYDLFHFPKDDGITPFVKDGFVYILVTDNQDHPKIFKANLYTFPSFEESSFDKQASMLAEMQV